MPKHLRHLAFQAHTQTYITKERLLDVGAHLI